jgi:hypothetical protein
MDPERAQHRQKNTSYNEGDENKKITPLHHGAHACTSSSLSRRRFHRTDCTSTFSLVISRGSSQCRTNGATNTGRAQSNSHLPQQESCLYRSFRNFVLVCPWHARVAYELDHLIRGAVGTKFLQPRRLRSKAEGVRAKPPNRFAIRTAKIHRLLLSRPMKPK